MANEDKTYRILFRWVVGDTDSDAHTEQREAGIYKDKGRAVEVFEYLTMHLDMNDFDEIVLAVYDADGDITTLCTYDTFKNTTKYATADGVSVTTK